MTPTLMDLRVVALDKVYRAKPIGKLAEWAMEGRISPADLVCPTGTQNWVPVTQMPELATCLRQGIIREPSLTGEEDPELDVDATSNWVAQRFKKPAEEAEMDMTPMIDVTFQLLIFFMLTNAAANPAPMTVPEAVHGLGVTPEGMQMVLVDESGKYYLGNKASEETQAPSLDFVIQEVTKNAAANAGPLDVIVSAHKTSKHYQTRELVDRLSSVQNLGKVMLGVEEKK
ncbi:MAG: biopolymer transporter ExbD [Planctomycetes bacterium]|nr:biopolymer transporter ExbD [Planctomycetota bacterium]